MTALRDMTKQQLEAEIRDVEETLVATKMTRTYFVDRLHPCERMLKRAQDFLSSVALHPDDYVIWQAQIDVSYYREQRDESAYDVAHFDAEIVRLERRIRSIRRQIGVRLLEGVARQAGVKETAQREQRQMRRLVDLDEAWA